MIRPCLVALLALACVDADDRPAELDDTPAQLDTVETDTEARDTRAAPPEQLDHVCAGDETYTHTWPVQPVDLAAAPPWGVWAVTETGARWQPVSLDVDGVPVSLCTCPGGSCSPVRYLLTATP